MNPVSTEENSEDDNRYGDGNQSVPRSPQRTSVASWLTENLIGLNDEQMINNVNNFSVLSEEEPDVSRRVSRAIDKRNPCVPKESLRNLPEVVRASTSQDLGIGSEMEGPTASENEYMVENSSPQSHPQRMRDQFEVVCISTSQDLAIGSEMEVLTDSEDEHIVENSSSRSHRQSLRDQPEVACIRTNHDLATGSEMEVSTSSSGSQRRPRRTSVATWLTQNVVRLNEEQMENDGDSEPILDSASNIPPRPLIVHPIRAQRFARDNYQLRVHCCILAMRRKVQSLILSTRR